MSRGRLCKGNLVLQPVTTTPFTEALRSQLTKTSTPSTTETSSSPAAGGQGPCGCSWAPPVPAPPASVPLPWRLALLATCSPDRRRRGHAAWLPLPGPLGAFQMEGQPEPPGKVLGFPPALPGLSCPEREPPPVLWVVAAQRMQQRLLGLLRSCGRHGCLSHLGMPAARDQPAALRKQDPPGQAHGQALESWELAAPLTGAPTASDSPL